LPVIAGEALDDLVFGGHDRLVASYAAHVGIPCPIRASCTRWQSTRA
jgi:hypothetical protein